METYARFARVSEMDNFIVAASHAEILSGGNVP